MTGFGTQITALLAAGAAAAGGILGTGSDDDASSGRPVAVVVDAVQARAGRELVDARLQDVDADVRLPRTETEAQTDVRYFDAQGYRIVVAGPQAQAAADSTGVAAERVTDLEAVLAAAKR